MNELEKISNGVQFNKNGLTIKKDLSVEDWLSLGNTLETMQGAIQWWIGDWLNYGEQRYGETYTQALDASKYSYETLANIKWVAKSIESSLRSESLSWSHHKEIAPLPKRKQSYFISLAQEERLSVSSLKKAINVKKICDCTIQDMEERVIYEYTCKHGKKIRQVAEKG
jgi:hypothetical protein